MIAFLSALWTAFGVALGLSIAAVIAICAVRAWWDCTKPLPKRRA